MMTLEVEDPLLDHFVCTFLDNFIIYEYWVGLVVVKVSGEMQ
jgi:hypothetical protein